MLGGVGRAALVSMMLVAGFGSGAAAQDEDEPSAVEEERARAYFMLGRSHYDAGEYAESIEQFEQAYALTPRPRLLYNLYQAHHRLGQLEPAIDYLERYLAEGDIDDQERPLLEARLANHRDALAAERQAAAEEAERQRLEEERRQREEEERQAELAAAREAAAQASPLRTAGWVVLGVGLAGAGAFALFGALALRENDDLSKRCGEEAGAFCEEDDLGTLQLLTRTADLGGAVGLAGIATGIVLLLVGRPAEPDAEEARLLPTTLPGGAGLQLRGRF